MPNQTYPWNIDGFDKRIEATGWPEWSGKHHTEHRLWGSKDGFWIDQYQHTGTADWYDSDVRYNPHVAASLIREHWRGWLKDRAAVVTWNYAAYQYLAYIRGRLIGAFDDIATAQAAIRAMEAKA